MKNTMLKIASLGLALMVPFGCSLDSAESGKPSEGDYVAEKQKIKANATSQAMLNEQVSALQKRYGIDIARNYNAAGGNLPDVVKGKPCENCATPNPIKFLPKVALEELDIYGVKTASVPIERPYYETFTVNPGEAITVHATATQSGVDPFLVLFQVVEGSMSDYKSQQKLSILGYNDDFSGLNPRVAVGTASTVRQIVVLLFAYDVGSKGQANVSVQIAGNNYTRNNVYVRGTALFYDRYNYINRNGEEVDLQSGGWARYLPGTTAFAGADFWGGDYTWGSYRPGCSGDSYIWAFNMSEGKGVANDDAVEGYCSGVMNDASWSVYPSGYHYPSVVVLGGYSDGGSMNFMQISAFHRVD